MVYNYHGNPREAHLLTSVPSLWFYYGKVTIYQESTSLSQGQGPWTLAGSNTGKIATDYVNILNEEEHEWPRTWNFTASFLSKCDDIFRCTTFL